MKTNEKRPLDLLFGSSVRVDVLWFLVNETDFPRKKLTIGEISKRINRSYKDVQRILDSLENDKLDFLIIGICSTGGTFGSGLSFLENPEYRAEVNTIIDKQALNIPKKYAIQTNHRLYKPLKILLEMEIGYLSVIQNEIRYWLGVDIAFIFGSYATGDQKDDSDIDLVLIGYRDKMDFYKLKHDLEKRVGKSIQFLHFTPDRWLEEAKISDSFVSSLLYKPKIFLVGSNEELGRISR